VIWPSRMLRKNLGCLRVVCFEVFIFSPFVTNTVEHGVFVGPVVKDALPLSIWQSPCHQIWPGRMGGKGAK
jgi:hypothetical protein